ncbi:GvpL/GvpF family gas vesicle protein [Saccharopolyspora karakumensis]|uniref:GvpL/GvpF family gas vesicle protein n=1 Tax=Saccharopolyspora karakumensis TaxID=2530386 RepID=A0A4V2YX11_9PSEU|nr:GvpL/GvpF family gas vesicle protein [Saccharopolyspora karakumensis]TDD87597.1 GvpL/GvpF family gas vesicle protein [Saccharopolyspora karakumensis]
MTAQADHQQSRAETRHGAYVYGITREQEASPGDLPAVGGESEVRVVSRGGLSALISDLELNRPLGTPEDLLAHERVLDAVAADTTVLPMRFGAVLADADAVADELLEPHLDEFTSALAELDGTIQYAVRGSYLDDAHLREVVAEDPVIAELREQLRGVAEDAAYDERVRLGELVHDAVLAKRRADAEHLVRATDSATLGSRVHDVVGESEALHVSFLVDRDQVSDFEDALGELGQRWTERIGLRQIGPLAPYDFVRED